MLFGRIVLGLALCLNAAAGDGAGGGAGGAGAGGGAGGAGAGPSAADLDKARAEAREAARKEARAEFLKEQGFDSEDAYKAHLDEKKKAEEAKLSEADKQKKLYNEALDARGKVESKLESEKAARKAAEAALAMRDRLDAHGVLPGERKFVEVALEEAEAAAKKAGQAFDEAKFFEELRGKRPYFFSKDAPQLATTGTNADAGAKNGTTRTTPSGLTFDASKLSDDEWAKWRRDNNV
jgi:hypothetical protein